MNYLTNLNLNKNELQNAVIQPLAVAPSNPKPGQIYYNSGDKMLYQYDGTNWVPVGELNIIESVEVNGVPLAISEKTVDVPVPNATTTTPAMDGTAAVGTETAYARGDHVHPSDTSKVDKVTGKGLSTNDYTTEEKNKLGNIAAGAQVNVIEAITVNNTAVTPTNKTVNINVPVQSVAGKTGAVTLAKGDVGLGNVDNTSDATKKSNFTGSIANGNTGFVTGGDAYTEFGKKLDKAGGTMTGAIAMSGNKITGVGDGVNDQDAVTVKQLNAAKLGALKPSGSIAFASLPTLSISVLNNIYNITDSFTTTADFVEGVGKTYPAGTNVAVINTGTDANPTYKFDAYTGVIDTSDYLTKSGLASSTGSAADNAMSQAAVTAALSEKQNSLTFDSTPTSGSTNPVTSGGIHSAIAGLIKTATGTISTSATSAAVSYTGTVLATRSTMSNEEVITDVTISSSAVTFATAAAPASAITCTVIYI